jgi:hypothetical protein|nr:MAG TPA: Protein of unknown function (DUF551) [Caudoviricetes sp.]
MKREKEIKQAAKEYTKNYDCFDGDIGDIEIGFMDGAEWADEHPANPWHNNIDGDLPKESGRYLVMAQNGYCHTCKYKADSRYWDTVGYQSDIAHWMEIPELPTE